MKWVAYEHTVFGAPRKRGFRSDDGRFSITPAYSYTQRRRKTKQVVYRLWENKHMRGNPFASAMLAKAFAEAYGQIEDRRERAEFLRNGGEWCWNWQNARRREMSEARWARYEAEMAAREAASE